MLDRYVPSSAGEGIFTARQRKLSPERKAFINSLLEHYQPTDANDVQEMLKALLGDTLQGMLKAEMDQKLGYSKYDYQNKTTDDSKNSYSKKTVHHLLEKSTLIFPATARASLNHRLSERIRQTFSTLRNRCYPCMPKA